MLKRLTAKTQELNPLIPAASGNISKALSIKPESEDVITKKGSIYLVFDVGHDTSLDTQVITNIIHDTLYNSYYQSENISPIQSLEKAIADTRDKILQIISSDNSSNVSFRMLAGVLWGNVLYVVQYGDGYSFLVRDGQVRAINTMSEGNFSAASGVIKEDDVIILCSKIFGDKYPPEKLLTTSIKDQELEPGEACLLLKFLVDTQFSEQEVVDFGLDIEKKSKKPAGSKIKNAFKLFKKSKSKDEKITENKQTFSIAPEYNPQTKIALKLNTKKKFTVKPFVLIPIVTVALLISILLTLKNRKDIKNSAEITKGANAPQVQNNKQEIEGTTTDIVTKDEEVFYDIRIANSEATPNEISATQDFIAVIDTDHGKIYTSSTTTPKFDVKEHTFEQVRSIDTLSSDSEKSFGFTDSTGFKVYNAETSKVASEYANIGSEKLGNITDTYLDFVYTIVGNKILKLTREDNTLSESTVWGESADFEGAKSMSIEYSIFVLTKDNSIVKYTAGDKTSFSLDIKIAPIQDAVKLLTHTEFDNVYIADKGTRRVIVVKKDGTLVNEFKNDKWEDIKSIAISPDEKTLYVLSTSKVYKVAL